MPQDSVHMNDSVRCTKMSIQQNDLERLAKFQGRYTAIASSEKDDSFYKQKRIHMLVNLYMAYTTRATMS
jgi:hypothetical protein